MKDFEKMWKYLVSDFIFMLVINAYLAIDAFVEICLLGSGALSFIVSILSVLLLIAGILCAKKGKVAGGVIGIVVGVLMILSLGIINIVLGIFMTIHSIVYLVNYNKNN